MEWIVEAVLTPDGENLIDGTFNPEPGRAYQGFRVVMSNQVATIRGQTPSSPLGMVVAFPDDETLWGRERLIRTAHLSPDGGFSIAGVPPGQTYLVAECMWPCPSRREDLKKLVPSARRVYVDRPGVVVLPRR